MERIESDGHFGVHKELGDLVCELKWGNGRRLYYAIIPENHMILLLGGNKNGQEKDIREAKKILQKYIESDSW